MNALALFLGMPLSPLLVRAYQQKGQTVWAAYTREELVADGKARRVLISLCCECAQVYGEKDAQGADGGVSDGVCPTGPCKDHYRVRNGLRPKGAR